MQLERRNGLQVLLRVAAELWTDSGERAVLPRLIHLEAGLDLAPRDEPRRLAERVIRILHTAGQKLTVGKDTNLRCNGFGRRVLAPRVAAGLEAIDLGEGPLEAVALDLLQSLLENGCSKGRAFALGGGNDLAVRPDDFRLEERRLVEQGVAIGVVAGDLKGDGVLAGLEAIGEVPLVHAEITMRAPGRSVAEELAVQEHAIDRRPGRSQPNPTRGIQPKACAKADKEVLLRLAPFGPDRLGR